MNKFFVAVFALLFAGSVYAYDFGVSATWTPEDQVSTVATEASVGQFLVGAEFDFQPFVASATFGIFQEVWNPEGSTVYGVARAGVPFYEAESFLIGPAFIRAGFMVIPDFDSLGSLSFEAGFVSDVRDLSITEFPGFYARAGVVF